MDDGRERMKLRIECLVRFYSVRVGNVGLYAARVMKGAHHEILVADLYDPFMWHEMVSPHDVVGPVDPEDLELASTLLFYVGEFVTTVVSEVMPCYTPRSMIIKVIRQNPGVSGHSLAVSRREREGRVSRECGRGNEGASVI
jgi:hypothetical protein